MNGSFKTPIGKSKTNPLPPRTSPPFKGGVGRVTFSSELG